MESSPKDPEQVVLDRLNQQRERRAHTRLLCKGEAEFRVLPDGPKVVGALLNFCMGGCLIEAENQIPVTTAFAEVEVQLKVDDYRLRLAGCIRHLDETRAGIQFTQVSSRKEEQIRTLMAELVEMEKDRQAIARAKYVNAVEE